MSTPTLSALGAPLLLLRMFSAEYPHLPAPCLDVSTVYPDLLTLSFHDDPRLRLVGYSKTPALSEEVRSRAEADG
ncbi:hypothetical protein OG754_19240 [Streptomyces decoyicus]|uniref:hypothetical protein n=1 Tax=Streptomyces decoyicus TaxID=249567 RepID=UPI002E3054B1|nr:hypothetical protein [Streptomyces decoyicus]